VVYNLYQEANSNAVVVIGQGFASFRR